MVSENSHGIDELVGFALGTIRQLGAAAMAYYGKGDPVMKFDEQLVTAADLHLRERFETMLKAQFPTHRIFGSSFSEEGYTHDDRRHLWIFDPIDGVDNFQTGVPIWAMSLALLDNFWPILGVVFMPATNDLFFARAGEEARHNDRRIAIPDRGEVNDESVIFTFSRFHQHYAPDFPGKIRNLGSTCAHICYVAVGRADAAVIANESYRDLAAARVIIEAAGGRLNRMDGGEFFLNDYLNGARIEDHLLAAAPGNYHSVRQCLIRK